MTATLSRRSKKFQLLQPMVSNRGRYMNRWGRKCCVVANNDGYSYVGIKHGKRMHQVQWATKSEQAANRTVVLSRSAMEYEARHSSETTWRLFVDIHEASISTGVSIHRIRQISKGHDSMWSKEYTFRVATGSNQADLPGEEWKPVVPSEWFEAGGCITSCDVRFESVAGLQYR